MQDLSAFVSAKESLKERATPAVTLDAFGGTARRRERFAGSLSKRTVEDACPYCLASAKNLTKVPSAVILERSEGFRYYFVPVEPNPPAPRSVPESSSLSVKLAVK